jgi:hypothetical protein
MMGPRTFHHGAHKAHRENKGENSVVSMLSVVN